MEKVSILLRWPSLDAPFLRPLPRPMCCPPHVLPYLLPERYQTNQPMRMAGARTFEGLKVEATPNIPTGPITSLSLCQVSPVTVFRKSWMKSLCVGTKDFPCF